METETKKEILELSLAIRACVKVGQGNSDYADSLRKERATLKNLLKTSRKRQKNDCNSS